MGNIAIVSHPSRRGLRPLLRMRSLSTLASLDLDAGILDDLAPLGVLDRDIGLELLARFLGRHEGEAFKLRQHPGLLEDLHHLGAEAIEDGLGRAGWRGKPDPAHGDDAMPIA